jgi:hypothetical protein
MNAEFVFYNTEENTKPLNTFDVEAAIEKWWL